MDQNNNEIPHSLNTNSQELVEYIRQAHDHLFLDKVIKYYDQAYDMVQSYLQSNKNDASYPKGLFLEIKDFHKETLFMAEQFKDEQDWICEAVNEHFKMSYKLIPNSPNVALKWESVMRVPIQNSCALIYQTELFNKWVPFCAISKNVKQIRMGHKVCYMMMDLPILSNREAYVRGYGVDRLAQSKQFLICSKSIHNENAYKEQHKIDTTPGKHVQIDVNFFTLQVTVINKNEFNLKCIGNFDPKMKFIPQSVLNFFTRKIGKMIYEKFIKQAKDIKGTDWEKAMKLPENVEFYSYINKRFDSIYTQI